MVPPAIYVVVVRISGLASTCATEGTVGHEVALLRYALDVCTIGCERGLAETCATLVADLAGDYSDSVSPPAGTAGGRRNPSGVGRAGVSPKESSRAGSAESRTRSAILSFEVPARGADGVSTR